MKEDTKVNELDYIVIPFWIIKVGNLFYVGGLKRQSEEYENAQSYELTNEESLAFPVFLEGSASRLAEAMGGIAIKKELPSKDLAILQENNSAYQESQAAWEEDQLKGIILGIKESGGIKLVKYEPDNSKGNVLAFG